MIKSYKDLLELMPPYVRNYISATELEDSTIAQYLYGIRIFLEWMIRAGYSSCTDIKYISLLELDALREEDFKRFFDHLCSGFETHRNTATKYKQATNKEFGSGVKGKMSVLKSLFVYLYNERLIQHFELLKFKGFQKRDKSGVNIVSFTEENRNKIIGSVMDLSRVLERNITRSMRNLLRDKAIMSILFDTGLRVSQVAELNADDVNISTNRLRVSSKDGDRNLPVKPTVIEAISNYLKDNYRAKPLNEDANKALFLSDHGKRISKETIQYIVKKNMAKAGVFSGSAKSCRHTFGKEYFENTQDIKATSVMLTHVDIGNAAHFYADTYQEELVCKPSTKD